MRTTWSIALITFKEGLRHRILYGIVIAALLILVFSVFVSGLFMRDLLKIILDICLSAVSIGGLLIPFFLTISMLAGDIEKKTIYTILAKPVTRKHYIIGKFLGLGLLTAIIMIILTATTLLAILSATLIYPAHNFQEFALTPILISSLMGFLGTLVLNSCVILWCCLTTSSFLATLLTLSTYVVGQSIEDIVRFLSMKTEGVEITPAIHIITKTTLYLFPNLAAFDLKQQAAYGLPITFSEIGFLIIYSSTYISIMLCLAVLFFNRRDLT
jgi:ABC-type transport system involved in multi-copper enzyme maturation permease subunit